MAPKREGKAYGYDRHLTYAWIEFGDSRDGQAFGNGMKKLGWRNLLVSLPRKRDSWGSYYVDSEHPLLPIRRRGVDVLISPNEFREKDDTYVNDPIFSAFRKAHGNDKFDEEIIKQNEFLSKWMFQPGLRKVSDTEGKLVLDSDFTDYADFIAVSGHGSNGAIWGGYASRGMDPRRSLFQYREPAGSDRLKYIIIATCANVSSFNFEPWLLAMRRKNPVHGFLGYCGKYPGDATGRSIFKRFTSELNLERGKTILSAWRESHTGSLKDLWGALLHVTSKNDTMKDWLNGNLTTPDINGEIRFYCESNYPEGKIAKPEEYNYSAFFHTKTAKIDRTNNFCTNQNVGFFPGETGYLEIAKKSGSFACADEIEVIFYYFREDHDPGMNLTKLLTFDEPRARAEGKLELESNLNKRDKERRNVDGFYFTFHKGVSKVQLHYTVNKEAFDYYSTRPYGPVPCYFFIRLQPPEWNAGGIYFYYDGVWLRKPHS